MDLELAIKTEKEKNIKAFNDALKTTQELNNKVIQTVFENFPEVNKITIKIHHAEDDDGIGYGPSPEYTLNDVEENEDITEFLDNNYSLYEYEGTDIDPEDLVFEREEFIN